MTTAVSKPIALKPETLELVKIRAPNCDTCVHILESLSPEGQLASWPPGARAAKLSVQDQKTHILDEVKAKPAPPQLQVHSETPVLSQPTTPSGPNVISNATIELCKARQERGCFLCKWIVTGLGPGNTLRDWPPDDGPCQFPVKSQRMHLELEFGKER